MIQFILSAVYAAGLGNVMYYALNQAYQIRTLAIEEYGRVIHEFDPYFNYRATEYLWQHGWFKFKTWFDYMSWYPLGRPVGTTIFPGMQATSCLIKKFILPTWSINDICCFVPAWFGVLATISTALLAYECSVGFYNKPGAKKSNSRKSLQEFDSILNSIPIVNIIYQAAVVPVVKAILDLVEKLTQSTWGLIYEGSSQLATPALESAVVTALIMSMIPAHLMRSVGGGYDNESIAMTAMTFTFYCWCRALRGTEPNLAWGIMSGFAYFYMVAAWGGYVFVLNLVGLHASLLVLIGRYSTKLHRAYTAFYFVGTLLAIQVPTVSWTPLKSLEQMGPLVAFLGFQLIEVCEIIKRRKKLSPMQTWLLRVQIFGVAAVVAGLVAFVLADAGYFGPISSRVRGLFVKHTKTGNPLVDSVAEHQPANSGAYFQYLDIMVYIAPIGFALVAFLFFHDSSSFLIVYGMAAYFFSAKMVRLILLTAPIASVLSGIAVAHFWAWGITAILGQRPTLVALFGHGEDALPQASAVVSIKEECAKKAVAGDKNKKKATKTGDESDADFLAGEVVQAHKDDPKSENLLVRVVRAIIFVYLASGFRRDAQDFHEKCHELSHMLSHPTIITKGRTRDGQEVVVDDYREAYWWLRDNTPEDARIMAWWDYGYQIAGIANRTTIADGNTWNHEHIALLGRILTSPLKDGHRIARHLADYVLIWAGGGGDDVAKSPHMRRIANSVYRFLCPHDPTCRMFGIDQYGQPTKSMQESLLYQLHSHNLVPGVEADKNRFKLVYETERGKVRIFKVLSVSKESKDWVADPANRVCDAPGSWFCRGQYPPALQKILQEKKDFRQLEDFNIEEEHDSEYTKAYFENLK
jgi:dolichyl-diphosphooligosaccharide--protein glycosyltransferase